MKRAAIYSLLLLYLLSSCLTFRKSDQRISTKFEQVGTQAKIQKVATLGGELRYFSAGELSATKPTVLFIHGAPRSGMDFFDYLADKELQVQANLIALDRLGYGHSAYGKAEVSISAQARAIAKIIEEHQLTKVILFGWSYGVPIAVKLAHEEPAIVSSLLVAGAISPADEKFFFLGKLVHWKATRWLFSKALRVADEEKSNHVTALTGLLPIWGTLQTPILYYHGTKDKIVPFENMNFIKRQVSSSILTAEAIEGANHFVAFTHYARVKASLLGLIEEVKKE